MNNMDKNRLKDLRKNKLHLSQTEFSKVLEIPQMTYSNYETGKTEITLSVLKKISQLYGFSIDYLCGNKVNTDTAGLSFGEKKNVLIMKIKDLDDDKVDLVSSYIDGLNDISHKDKNNK